MTDDTIAAPAALGDDLLIGAAAIAQYIGQPKRRIFYLAENGLLPIGREGATLVASRRALTEHYRRLTAGAGE